MSLYFSPPGSGGNDGAVPATYVVGWEAFTNLTPTQKLAFQTFPQDLVLYATSRGQLAEFSGVTVNSIPLNTSDTGKAILARLHQAMAVAAFAVTQFVDAQGVVHQLGVPQVNQLFVGMVQYVNSIANAFAQLSTGINAATPTITTRSQIDAVYAPLAPNSPSAINPSPT